MLRLGVLASAALAALTTGSFAADLPTMKGPPPAPVVAPVYNWTGFYLGVNAGGAWGSTNIQDPGAFLGIPASQTIGASGFIGGGQLGFNYQFGGNFVIGGELELDGMDLDGSKTASWGFGGADRIRRKVGADWLGTAGLRLGYAVDRMLFFVKGGGAATDYNYRDETTNAAGTFVFNNATNNADRWGWMIGGGVEWAFAANWTAKAEYDYIDFGRQNITLNSVGGNFPAAIPLGISDSISLAKIGINYKF